MTIRARWIVIMTLLAAADAAAGNAATVRRLGVSPSLRTLAAGIGAQDALQAPAPLVRSVAPQMKGAPRKSLLASIPYSAHPLGPGTPAMAPVSTGGTRINRDGMQTGSGAAGVTAALGEKQYVQLANGLLAVYGKDDGALQLGPVALTSLFAGAGATACARQAGSASVHYDQLAGRWILSYQASAAGQAAAGPFQLCIAVSTGPDAAGRYVRYALATEDGIYPDDPHMALWPDAYYFSFSLFDIARGSYRGPRICGVERRALLEGRDPALRCSDPGDAFGPVAVASVEGANAPPRGSPALILSLDFTEAGVGRDLTMWRFSFASASPGKPIAIPVAPFAIACQDAAGACIRQPAPGGILSAAGDRLAPRIAYRNDGGRESLVLAHPVQLANGQGALRWYELRDPRGAVQVYQQGSHASNGADIWMGSIGKDKAGNIALGYGVSGAEVAPGVRYSGRQHTDPHGRLQGEEIVINGSGVQQGDGARWRAGGALALDPVDGCTFWYTQQYIASTGPTPWRTRIASFKFLNCE